MSGLCQELSLKLCKEVQISLRALKRFFFSGSKEVHTMGNVTIDAQWTIKTTFSSTIVLGTLRIVEFI